MARKPQGYWEERQTRLMKRIEKDTVSTIADLVKIYSKASKDIEKEINKIFNKYATDGKLTRQEANKLLSIRETQVFYKDLLKQINTIDDIEIKRKLLAKYNAPAYSYRISRYKSMQANIDLELKKLMTLEEQITKQRYIKTIQETYYENIFNVQKYLGYGFEFAHIDNRTIQMMLAESWIDNSNFSKNIWENNEKLGEYLKTQLTADTMSGKSIQKISKELVEHMNVGLYNAVRLVRTEVNHFANEAEMLSYEELNIDKYKFIATLDNVTCGECAKLDNKIFKVKDRIPR